MSLAPKNKASLPAQHELLWQPSATNDFLKQRAHILRTIRDFFNHRGVMEVETPLLCHTSVTDPFIASIPAIVTQRQNTYYYLQTSPEYAMKRLLAAGSGPIYQITKAFRQGEAGNMHNPEFTMLEWYRPNFDHHMLMDEMDALLQAALKTQPADRCTYQELFSSHLQLDAHHASLDELSRCAQQHELFLQDTPDTRDDWLNLLLSHCIEPQIGKDRPVFVYDFPTTQAMLARIRDENPPVASRFEVYYKGIELANGFHELQNAAEQRDRFEANLRHRKKLGLANIPIDENFLQALEHGLPDCAGVALGIDRLVMLAVGARRVSDVISFDFSRA